MSYSSGTFTILNQFSPNTTILSSKVNGNFNDIATGLSSVLTLAGDKSMTGVLKLADGSAAAPGLTWGADTDTGFYRIGANRLGFAAAGSDVAGSNLYAGVRIGLPPGFNSVRVAQATDTDHDVTFAAGRCRDSTDAEDIVLASAITKQIDAAWAVGTNAGGLDTGTVANNTIYYLWVIKRSDTGVVDALFSTSATAPTMPADYDLKQRVGWVRTNSSANILAFVQAKNDINEIRYVTTIEDVDATQGTSSTSRTMSLPPNSLALIRANVGGSGQAELIIRPLTETSAVPLQSDVPGSSLIIPSGGGASAGDFEVELNSSAQLATRMASLTSVNLHIYTKGCRFLAPIIP